MKKNMYYTPIISVKKVNLDDVICVSFDTKDENNIYQNVDVTLD